MWKHAASSTVSWYWPPTFDTWRIAHPSAGSFLSTMVGLPTSQVAIGDLVVRVGVFQHKSQRLAKQSFPWSLGWSRKVQDSSILGAKVWSENGSGSMMSHFGSWILLFQTSWLRWYPPKKPTNPLPQTQVLERSLEFYEETQRPWIMNLLQKPFGGGTGQVSIKMVPMRHGNRTNVLWVNLCIWPREYNGLSDMKPACSLLSASSGRYIVKKAIEDRLK